MLTADAWNEAGQPYIQNFSPSVYNGGTQNFSIVQDEQGLIYVGNGWGVLAFDGVSWRLMRIPGQGAVRSLLVSNDRLYAGGVGEFGYFTADKTGRSTYVSLLDDIPAEYRNFKDVYDIIEWNHALFFRTRDTLFRLKEGEISVIETGVEFGRVFVLEDKMYVMQRSEGLMQISDEGMRLLPDGELFADKLVTSMLPYDETGILISTFNSGLFLYDGRGMKRLQSPADLFMREKQVRDGIELQNGFYAYGTGTGVVIIDKAGNICRGVNKAAGLIDELNISLFSDTQGGLWLALNNGIARIELLSPVTRFDDKSGIQSYVSSIIRHDGILYASTDREVLYLDETAFPFPGFKPVSGLATLSWSFLSVADHLLLGTQDGIYKIEKDKATRINSLSAITLHNSLQNSNLVFAGLLDGLAAMRQEDGNWQYLGKIPGISERIYSIVEDESGAFWLGTQTDGVIKIRLSLINNEDMINPETDGNINSIRVAEIMRYGQMNGLPAGPVTPSLIGDRIFFKTIKGLRSFDPVEKVFKPDSTFGDIFADTLSWINSIRNDQHGNAWIVAGNQQKNYTGKLELQPDGSYQWEETPFLRMYDLGRVYFSYPESDGTVWFGGAQGIARYSPVYHKNYHNHFSTIIRKVRGISDDSVYYHGALPDGLTPPQIKYAHNSLRFEFAALSYDDPSRNRYQVKLDGFDAGWSNWSSESKKDYTGLPAGKYIFRVRGKNIYEHLSSEAGFSFIVLHPWYQTGWAYVIYMMIVGSLIFGIVKVRVRHLERKNTELESIIKERTQTLRDQTEKLQNMDELKSRFYANISHELRTPLTLILGPLEERLTVARTKKETDELNVMYRNAKRILRLVVELLDLSRLESGKMKLKAGTGNFIELARGIVMSFATLAEQKNISLHFRATSETESEQVINNLFFDGDKIEKILVNLLSNAFKFTSEDGVVCCKFAISQWGETGGEKLRYAGLVPEAKCLEITISDTGAGIPEAHLPHIFDRFFQVDSTSTREQEGTGIGLALARELVYLHYGRIEVQSRENEGTTFTVRLPLGKDHLLHDEIDSSENHIKQGESLNPDFDFNDHEFERLNNSKRANGEKTEQDIILLVEDNPDVSRYLRRHLETNYSIIEARNGIQGLEKADEFLPDLVISDVMMPKMNGFELCNSIKTKESTSHIPVILLSARSGDQDVLSGLKTGADDYLTKPFSPEQLLARVSNLIDTRRNLRLRFVREGILQPREIAATSVDEQFLHSLMSVIEDNLAVENFSVSELGAKLFTGNRQLHRKVRGLTGKSPAELIRTVRLHRAMHLLEKRAGTVTEIAGQVGFNNLSHFAKVFRDEFGILPSDCLSDLRQKMSDPH
ncbi:MAG: response regulator [Rhodothermaceae bacterium]|nr:response regulator [Rhodothermaceae bacterium]